MAFSFVLDLEILMFPVPNALGVFSIVAKSSGAHIPLQGIRGGFVLIHVIKKQEAEPEEVSWGFGPELNYRVFLRVHRGKDTPTWVSLQDKYQQRVHVPNVTSLRIENLTPEDSGQYRARASFTGGIEFTQVFRLTVNGKWHLRTLPYGFPPAFVVGVSHRIHFSGSLQDISLHILFSHSELG